MVLTGLGFIVVYNTQLTQTSQIEQQLTFQEEPSYSKYTARKFHRDYFYELQQVHMETNRPW